MTTVDLYAHKEQCCGCSMCASSCPVGIISMVSDEEGFLYPHIDDNSKCIGCKKCLAVCPVKRDNTEPSSFESFYAGSMKEKEDLISCASGGIATDMARGFVRTGGVVYGAAYSTDWKTVEYIRCDHIEELERLKTSKYAQADKKDAVQKLSLDLKNGMKCLFIGLPCDVAAVAMQYGRYENLFTAELICHGPTSNGVNREYCEWLENRFESKLDFFSTRHKRNGKWKPFYIFASFKNGKQYYCTFHESEYGAAFRYLKRPSCYSCAIKGDALKGDIMLGDYHYVEKGMAGYNPNGVSSVLIHNEKGRYLLELCKNAQLTQISPVGAKANGAIFNPISRPADKEAFSECFVNKG